jgi:DNA-binding MarR family transcriptional regulator
MDERKRKRAVDTMAANCVAVRLRLVNRVITNLYDEALRPLGLKISQLNILVVAAKLGVAQPAQVCEILQLDASTLSRNVERMRSRGWVEVVPGNDLRTQSFRLTPQGLTLLDQAIPAWEQAQAKAIRLLGRDGVPLLDKLTRNLVGQQVIA